MVDTFIQLSKYEHCLIMKIIILYVNKQKLTNGATENDL